MEVLMSWLLKAVWTSIGKKLLMAGTGLCFCCFLVVHLAGNLTLYGGSNAFSAYAEKLHQLGVIVAAAEWGLVLFALVHVGMGGLLFFENLSARPVRYHRHKRAGGRTIGSATMPYTGFVVLVFLIYHLLSFRFTGEPDPNLYQIVITDFNRPLVVIFYIIAILIITVHISHGFWSAFQSIGADNIKYTPLIKAIRSIFCVILAVGFGAIPVYLMITS
jgi:succinate dehydrogenase / fumarate reductase cytochrome b subunit